MGLFRAPKLHRGTQFFVLCLFGMRGGRFRGKRRLFFGLKNRRIVYFLFTAGLTISYALGPRWDNAVTVTRSDFKTESSFEFLSPDYTGKGTFL